MIHSISADQIHQEGRLLFALLDAIENEHLISGTPFQTRWRAIKARIDSGGDYEMEAEESFELLTEIEHSGAIRDTWMEQRWQATDARIQDGT